MKLITRRENLVTNPAAVFLIVSPLIKKQKPIEFDKDSGSNFESAKEILRKEQRIFLGIRKIDRISETNERWSHKKNEKIPDERKIFVYKLKSAKTTNIDNINMSEYLSEELNK